MLAAEGDLSWSCRGSAREHLRCWWRQTERGQFLPSWPSGAGSVQAGLVHFRGTLLIALSGGWDIKAHAAASHASWWQSRGQGRGGQGRAGQGAGEGRLGRKGGGQEFLLKES